MENSNILFSSVKGAPSFVHSPHVPYPIKINSGSYRSILDPNIELPELTNTDIEEYLADVNSSKIVKDANLISTESDDFDTNILLNKSLIKSSSVTASDLCNEISDIPLTIKCVVKNCNQIFKSKSAQMEHFVESHKDKVITCPTCDAVMISKYSLQNHFLVRPECKVKVTYRCTANSECDRYFFSKHNLEVHMSQTHHLCAISCLSRACCSKFADTESRDDHMRLQHPEATYPCHSCAKVFLDAASYNRHATKSHLSSGGSGKPQNSMQFVCSLKCFVCSVVGCQKYFSTLSNLKRHHYNSHKQFSVPDLLLGAKTSARSGSAMETTDKPVSCTDSIPMMPAHIPVADVSSEPAAPVEVHQPVPVVISSSEAPPGPAAAMSSLAPASASVTTPSSLPTLLVPPAAPANAATVRLVFACPLPECQVTMDTKTQFESHFLKHFTGELPGDINSLLPPDPPVPGLELHSKTFEANVDSLCQREETNLLQALDLVPDKLLQSLDFLDEPGGMGSIGDPYGLAYLDSGPSEHHDMLPGSGLTSALMLPPTLSSSILLGSDGGTDPESAVGPGGSCRRRHHMGPASFPLAAKRPVLSPGLSHPGYSTTGVIAGPTSLLDGGSLRSTDKDEFGFKSGLSARTCPRVAASMAGLARRRRALLRERVLLQHPTNPVLCQPAGRQPALQQVVRLIFTGHQQQLPAKYDCYVSDP